MEEHLVLLLRTRVESRALLPGSLQGLKTLVPRDLITFINLCRSNFNREIVFLTVFSLYFISDTYICMYLLFMIHRIFFFSLHSSSAFGKCLGFPRHLENSPALWGGGRCLILHPRLAWNSPVPLSPVLGCQVYTILLDHLK